MPPKQSSLFGGFSDPRFITTDPDPNQTDKYIQNEPIPSRHLGKNFKIGQPKKGRTVDVFFDKKFLTRASADQNHGKTDEFEDPGKVERRARAEAKKKNIANHDFRYVSYPKKSTGPGSFVGTLQNKPFSHEPDYKVTQRGDVPERPKPQPKNIKTAPGKKGTYGYVGTTFSKPVERAPVPDVYDQIRINERKAWEEAKKKQLGGTWKSLGHLKGTFDEKGCTGIPSVYDAAPIPETKEKKIKKEEKPTIELKPFKYSSPSKSGQVGCLNKFPNTRGDNPDPYDTHRQKMKEDKAKGPKPLAGTWKPVSGPKQAVVKSLLKRYY